MGKPPRKPTPTPHPMRPAWTGRPYRQTELDALTAEYAEHLRVCGALRDDAAAWYARSPPDAETRGEVDRGET